jgi:beta-barrel assembly-enhancing protease
MEHTTDAKYYDGQSSIAQQIKIQIDESTQQLCLSISEYTVLYWHFTDLSFEKYGHTLEIRNPKFPSAYLNTDNTDFNRNFYTVMNTNKHVNLYTRLLQISFKKIVGIAFILLGLMVLSYFYVVPIVAEKSVVLLPQSFDDKIGDMATEGITDYSNLDSQKTLYLNQFAAKLNLSNTKPLRFSVIQSDEVNAFALPNGQIFVYTGILQKMKSSHELAALLGHEASHVNQRHSMQMICRNLAGYLLISVLLTDVNGVMSILVDNAQQLHNLSYSRHFEQEADELGLKILQQNNLDPQGIVRLFDQLEKASKLEIPKILSSHPLTLDRRAHMQQMISGTRFKISPNPSLDSLFFKLKSSN